MRILLLADSNSPHTLRWSKSIRNQDHTIGIFSLHTADSSLYSDTPDISLFSLNASRELQTKNETNLSKLIYLSARKKVKQIIKEFKPDIVHSHYASSYGLIGALSGFHPYVISLWGGDIFSFPKKSVVYKQILKFSLSKADKILSTSKIMKEETKKYTDKEVLLTPFGIDVDRFIPDKINKFFKDDDFVMGTIKTLEKNYGVNFLIEAFAIVKKKFPDKPLKLLIVGKGTQKESLEEMVRELGIEKDTIFTGYVDHNNVQDYHNMLDIYVAMSLLESFGVAVLEASACGKPVIVSNVGGLPEVVENGKTGFIVEKGNSKALAEALSKLICEPDLAVKMGNEGRNKVIREYDWKESVNKMISIYKTVAN